MIDGGDDDDDGDDDEHNDHGDYGGTVDDAGVKVGGSRDDVVECGDDDDGGVVGVFKYRDDILETIMMTTITAAMAMMIIYIK